MRLSGFARHSAPHSASRTDQIPVNIRLQFVVRGQRARGGQFAYWSDLLTCQEESNGESSCLSASVWEVALRAAAADALEQTMADAGFHRASWWRGR